MNTDSFLTLKKKAKAVNSEFPSVNVALLGDSATQWLAVALKGMATNYNLSCNLFESDFDQIDQQIFNPTSELYTHQPEFVIISKSVETLEKKYFNLEGDLRGSFADSIINQTKDHIETLQSRLPHSKILCFNLPELMDLTLGHYALKSRSSFRFQIQKINFSFSELAQTFSSLSILDVNALQSQYGLNNRIDHKFYIQSNQTFHINFLPLLSNHLWNIISAIRGSKLNKCLILDLDNTTWGGIIGDDGIEKIEIGSLGNGKAFTRLQSWAKSLKQRGIILCICSKNTEEVAKDVFINHPEMVLRLDDIAVFVANWENKADNIRYIQKVLNIGFDSMVFLDDNPFERNLVRQELPSVKVPELPEDPAEYVPYLRTLNLFETASISAEDSTRTKRYQEEAQRTKDKTKFNSIEDYLKGLDMEAVCEDFNSFSVPRISQLTQRSNQYNLRTKRYSESQIFQFIDDNEKITLQLHLKDKYGDYGLVSVMIGERRKEEVFIDTWLMSCRVLKRDVERFALNELVRKSANMGAKYLKGEYIPTAKNKLVQNHYPDLGFQKGSKENQWILSLEDYNIHHTHIKSKSRLC